MQFIKAFIIPIVLLLVVLDMIFYRFLLKISGGLGMGIYFVILILCLEYYSFYAFRTLNKTTLGLGIYIVLHLWLYGSFIYFAVTGPRGFSSPHFKKMIIILTLFIVPKIFLAAAMILEDVGRIIGYTYQSITHTAPEHIPGRRKALAWIALGIAAIPFIGVLDGILFGKYRYRVIKKKIKIKGLPKEFEGFTITQLSDIHSGSFDNKEKVEYGVNMALAQDSDILVFTGDMVNNYYKEMLPWKETFAKLRAKHGMYATLGNHDYGDYGNLTPAEKKESIAKLQEMQREMGFKTLNNQKDTIERNGKRLNIIGVENWGSSHYFPKKGDLRKAAQGVQKDDINILLSHDPSYFDHDIDGYDNIINFPQTMHLTLSGHTHGMQFGIEIPGLIKWSPVKYRYHNWAGLYQQKGRQLYVNRGFGYLAFPGRVGEWPEITVLELTKA